MTLIADILLISGAFGAALYCMILSRRLARLSNLDGGLGKAIADLNAQVTDLSKTLQEARATSGASAERLADMTERAEAVAASLDIMLRDAAAVSEHVAGPPGGHAPPNAPRSGGPVAQAKTKGDQGQDGRPAMPAFIRGRSANTAAE